MGLPLEQEQDTPPSIQEQVGAAVNASVLTLSAEHERPLDRIGALGGAARTIALNRDSEQLPNPVETDRLAALLGPLLWRVKFGGDRTHASLLAAVRYFADWMKYQAYWRKGRGNNIPAEQFKLFAARVIYEWDADKCAACAGVGLQELLPNGMTRRPRRFADPDVRHTKCRACQGTGSACVHPNARAQAIEVSLGEYKAHWPRRFDFAAAWLRGIVYRVKKPLQSELERDKNRF
jgi:hypothetical protein